MAKSYEEISNYNSSSNGKTDANLSNDALHLGGIEANEYVTKKHLNDFYGKEETQLKNYIDIKDNDILNQAKEHANALVRNQDFSGFAKITDVQALNTNLSNKINECSKNCLNNLKTKTDEIVIDVNANFKDVNTAISKLNNNYKDLFQSVSSGKKLVAEAITDKGVTTSATASFQTMANNIKDIEESKIIIPEGYVNTSDATATASDISLGKTAYVNGEKVYGTNMEVNISQVTPTYGTDTSGATATDSDILSGKTAYANGRLLVGTLNSGVQEIYGLKEGEYTKSFVSGYSNIIDNTDSNISYNSTGVFGISKDGRFIVNEVIVNNNGSEIRCIQSRGMNDEEVHTFATHGTETEEVIKRKSIWSFKELGLDTSKPVDYISFGNSGFGGVQDALLCIIQGNKVHFYLYDVSGGSYGYIGKVTNGMWHWTAEIKSSNNAPFIISGAAACSNLRPNIFVVCGKYENQGLGCLYILEVVNNTVIINKSRGTIQTSSSHNKGVLNTYQFSVNDNYIYGTRENNYNEGSYTGGLSIICKVNIVENHYYAENTINVPDTCVILPNEVQAMCHGYLYSLTCDDGVTPMLSKESETQYNNIRSRYAWFSPDLLYYYCAYDKPSATEVNSRLLIYKTDFSAIEQWSPVQEISLPKAKGNEYFKIEFSHDMSFGTAGNDSQLVRIRKALDNENIVGVSYKGQNYYKSIQRRCLKWTN